MFLGLYGPQHSLGSDLSPLIPPQSMNIREKWFLQRMKELRAVTAAKFSLHTPTKGLLLQAHVPGWAGSFCGHCLPWHWFCTCTRALLHVCAVNQSQLTQQPGLGFALFVALIKPSLMREPVVWLIKRAIKRVRQQSSLSNPKGVINRHNEISWTLSRAQL